MMIEQWEAEGGGGGRGVERALDHLKPGAQVWLSDTEEKKEEEGEDCTFCQFMQTSRPVLLVTLKPAVNEAASLQRGEKKKKKESECSVSHSEADE